MDSPGETRLTADIEAQPETKTSLSRQDQSTSLVLWSQEDQIGVFLDGASSAKTYSLIDGAGTNHAVFSGEGEASEYIAFYPKSMLPSLSNATIRLTVPAEQTYEAGSFASGVYPMAAKSGSSSLSFRNLASVLRLSITGHHPVTRIVFRSNDASIKVSGKASVSMASADAPVLTIASTGCDSLAMIFPESVQLKEDAPTDFFLVLPAQTYKSGFTVRVYTEKRYMDKRYDANFTMQRSQLHPAGTFEFQPNGVDVSTTLEGDGTESSPFLILSLGDLLFMQESVNAAGTIKEVAAAGAWYRLTTDIDLSPACSEKLKKSWIPIGSEEHPFSGTFSGEEHKISNLYINAPANNYQGLFGYVTGSGGVRKLTVEGSVSSSVRYVGMVAGYSAPSVSRCTSLGKVSGTGVVGGITGASNSRADNCVNKADVSGSGFVGGIVGEAYYGAINCRNEGAIVSNGYSGGILGLSGNFVCSCSNTGKVQGANDAGGIVGNQNSGVVMNCYNAGPVFGNNNVGGITGYSRQGSRIFNSSNIGDVSGQQKVGGITGLLSSDSSVNWNTTITSCLNLGTVTAEDAQTTGALAGVVEGATSSGFDTSILTQSYWLYDPDKGLGMASSIGTNEGQSSANRSLSDAQMKGAAATEVLYTSFAGISYTHLVDALNAWAYDNRNLYNGYEFQGWKYDAFSGYPVLTGIPVQNPGGTQDAFSISETAFEVLPQASQIEIEVLSTLEYTVDYPAWISVASVKESPTTNYTKVYTFQVASNDTDSDRKGSIVFTNTAGTVLKASVTQQFATMNVDVTPVAILATGAAKKIIVEANIPWAASSADSWCTVSPQKGSGSGVVAVKALVNESYSARATTVTIASADGRFFYTVSVIQAGKVDEEEVDWTQYPFIHQSLFMRFTATWCGWCPRMNKSVHKAQELYPDKIQHLALHGGGSDLQFASVSPLQSQYAITGFPTGIVDGRTLISNYAIETAASMIVSAVQETEKTYGTLTGADITSSVSGTTATVEVGVYLKKAGNYKLTVLLVEDGIINAQSDYEDGDHDRYTHDCVARVALSNVSGEAFTADEANTVKRFSYSGAIPSGCNIANMRVLVYIQRAFGSDTVIQSGSYGDYFVDNVATVELGDTLKLALEGASGGGGGNGGDGNEGIEPGDDIDM